MPTVPVEKQTFMTPADMLEEKEMRAAVAKVVLPSALVGTWNNCDKQTRGLLRLVIGATGNAISVHAYGACTPSPCDWGNVPALAYSTGVGATPGLAFTAHYKFSFKDTILVGHIERGALVVETFDHFTDNSGRNDYWSIYDMAQ